jgi:ankyrin repeat protein
LEKAARCG